jgi:DNA-binding response OmpR family regulator
MTRLLVVDDEELICRMLGRALRSAGYEVDSATTGPAALDAVRAHSYDMIVLDLMLPGMPGSDVLRRLLDERPDRRVLVLSAAAGVEARVGCLEAGAVDYLAKPFALAELLARIRRRLRPAWTVEQAMPAQRPSPYRSVHELRVGDVMLDTRRRSLRMGDRQRPLSHREYTLLLHLMQRAGEVCTRAELLSAVWGYTFDPGSNVVDVYIRRLRAKLDAEHIATVRNVGYSFVAA